MRFVLYQQDQKRRGDRPFRFLPRIVPRRLLRECARKRLAQRPDGDLYQSENQIAFDERDFLRADREIQRRRGNERRDRQIARRRSSRQSRVSQDTSRARSGETNEREDRADRFATARRIVGTG